MRIRIDALSRRSRRQAVLARRGDSRDAAPYRAAARSVRSFADRDAPRRPAMRRWLVFAALAAASLAPTPAAAEGFCTAQWAPVCAVKDGVQKTYSNVGCAKADGAEVVQRGSMRRGDAETDEDADLLHGELRPGLRRQGRRPEDLFQRLLRQGRRRECRRRRRMPEAVRLPRSSAALSVAVAPLRHRGRGGPRCRTHAFGAMRVSPPM